MPFSPPPPDSQLVRLPSALRAQMRAKGHTQVEVSRLTGVAQPQISKALKGTKKRLTQPMLRLCRYANLEGQNAAEGVRRAADLLVEATLDKPDVALRVEALLHDLAHLIRSDGAAR